MWTFCATEAMRSFVRTLLKTAEPRILDEIGSETKAIQERSASPDQLLTYFLQHKTFALAW